MTCGAMTSSRSTVSVFTAPEGLSARGGDHAQLSGYDIPDELRDASGRACVERGVGIEHDLPPRASVPAAWKKTQRQAQGEP
jgi:hypothetical protein